MRDHPKSTAPSEPNAFTPSFLHRLDPQDDPLTATEAAAEGPWHAMPLPGADPAEPWTVTRTPAPCGGDTTAGTFAHRATACLLATALPLAARDATYRLASEPDEAGFPLLRGSTPVAHLPWYHDELVAMVNVLDALARSPRAMAALLEAAGPTAVRRVGAELARRMG
jgi:hypothetical protein